MGSPHFVPHATRQTWDEIPLVRNLLGRLAEVFAAWLATMPAFDPHRCILGTSAEQLTTDTTSGLAMLGVTRSNSTSKKCRQLKEQHQQIQTHLQEHDLLHLNARQAFAQLRGPHQQPAHITPPQPCHSAPPTEPNTYTDGSLTNSSQPDFNLGGAGVWHPQGDLQAQPASETEAQLAVFQQMQQGLQVFINLPGLTTSSTRAELAGAILAIARTGPVHFGTDSQALVRKLTYIHQLIGQDQMPKRLWAFHKDGDLWSLYHQHAKAKGINGILVTKVKGHATTSMVTAGQVRPQDKEGNDAADDAADEGVGLFPAPVVHMGKQLAERQASYAHFVKHLLQHMAFTFRIRAALIKHKSQPQTIHHSTTATSPSATTRPTTQVAAPTYQPTPRITQHQPHRLQQLLTMQQCPQSHGKVPCSNSHPGISPELAHHGLQPSGPGVHREGGHHMDRALHPLSVGWSC